MRIALALRELHRAEKSLARTLVVVADRHRTEHEVHHVARDLAGWSRTHVDELAKAAGNYDLRLDDDPPSSEGPLAPVRRKLSELMGRRDEPGVLLVADLRRIHRAAAGVSLDWELLAQGAQAVKDTVLASGSTPSRPKARWSSASGVRWTCPPAIGSVRHWRPPRRG